jgi:hypothetical protein
MLSAILGPRDLVGLYGSPDETDASGRSMVYECQIITPHRYQSLSMIL